MKSRYGRLTLILLPEVGDLLADFAVIAFDFDTIYTVQKSGTDLVKLPIMSVDVLNALFETTKQHFLDW